VGGGGSQRWEEGLLIGREKPSSAECSGDGDRFGTAKKPFDPRKKTPGTREKKELPNNTLYDGKSFHKFLVRSERHLSHHNGTRLSRLCNLRGEKGWGVGRKNRVLLEKRSSLGL